MKAIKVLVGICVFLGGIVLGIYVGLVKMIIGGIIDVVNGSKANPTDGSKIGWGIVKVLLGGTVGEIVAFVFMAIGIALIASKPVRLSVNRRRRSSLSSTRRF
jgi:hypothetical protein